MNGSDNHKPRVVLASRKNAGIRVTLLWAPDTKAVAVHVFDAAPPGGASTIGPRTCGRRLEQGKASTCIATGCRKEL
jgi:hypothetical protein